MDLSENEKVMAANGQSIGDQSVNKVLAYILAASLVSGGSGGAIFQLANKSSASINKQTTESLERINRTLRRLQTDPLARPNAYTASMAEKEREQIEKTHQRMGRDDERARQDIRELRNRISTAEGGLRTLDVQISLDEARLNKMDELLKALERRLNLHDTVLEHAGAKRKFEVIDGRVKKLEKQ